MAYRKDIQVLRGVAVALVVLFHLGVGGFEGGFLGVDVFFVISGYLMATIYDPLRKRDFFIRRATRLLPAYFAVIGATLAAALFVTIPNEHAQIATQAWFAVPFASNIGFWMDESYFDKSLLRPLLHLWSLGVEIQFYAAVPLLAWIFHKARGGFTLILLGSALLCFIALGSSPKTAFYWMPCRLWEFLLGYGVAKFVYRPAPAAARRRWLGAAALLALACIALAAPGSGGLGFRAGHPGLGALLIAIACATVLACGLPAPLERSGAATVFERLGRYSYSIYLAHFPVIVLFLYQPFAGTVLKAGSAPQLAALALLVAAASALLYRCVELPLRTAGRATPRLALFSALAVLGIAVGGGLAQKALTPERELRVLDAYADRGVFRCGKLNNLLAPRARSCELTRPIARPSHRLLLVGNSHADAIKDGLAAAAQARNASLRLIAENNPLFSNGMDPEAVLAEARAHAVDTIVLHFSPRVDFKLEQVLALARRDGVRVALIMPVPTWPAHIPQALWDAMQGRAAPPVQHLEDYLAFNADLIGLLGRIDDDGLRVYHSGAVLCDRACRYLSADGRPFYYDSNHLTLTGSAQLRGLFARLVADLRQGRAAAGFPAAGK
ncbi:acyltransferase family protein [Massilia glaciei]|uniref:Acyltransferase n=1 Tax=Massilia glaciei TaxID=1524097 RepID=A0A2U2HIQ9_9BURK|nr:acyltransferase family protein [Massilia glaciei]PWF46642.1 acyltransferase [Massilia glaciei]